MHCITKQNDGEKERTDPDGRGNEGGAWEWERGSERERKGGGKWHCSCLLLSPPLPLLCGLIERTHMHTSAQLPPKQHTKAKNPKRIFSPIVSVQSSLSWAFVILADLRRWEEGETVGGSGEIKDGWGWMEDKQGGCVKKWEPVHAVRYYSPKCGFWNKYTMPAELSVLFFSSLTFLHMSPGLSFPNYTLCFSATWNLKHYLHQFSYQWLVSPSSGLLDCYSK